MSDLKVDGIISSTGTNTNLELSGKGSGGVKITDYLIQTKGADISSATSLTLGKDGNQFDVTGTTTITSIATQGIGSYVTLHFDGALTFTHDATNLILPGAANITTAAGDIAVMYEYASADWRCVSFTKASGAAVVAAAGGAWNIIGTAVASSSASLTITGIDSTYDAYFFSLSAMLPATDTQAAWIRVGDSSGVDSSGSDYRHVQIDSGPGFTTVGGVGSTGAAQIIIDRQSSGNVSGEGLDAYGYLLRPADAGSRPMLHGCTVQQSGATNLGRTLWAGDRNAVITCDRIQFLFASGNIASGRMTVWGIAHA